MPWKETTTMDQKIEFICEWRTGKYTITELCKAFEISRPTAYKLIYRLENYGIEGFKNMSKSPRNHPNKTKDGVEQKIIELKEKHNLWGAKKIRKLLFNDCYAEDIPSVVTVHNILSRHGFVKPQKRCRRVKPVYPIFDPKECNEVWSADYKGKFYMGNKKYCHPLTIADSKSRFLFTAKGHYRENYKEAKAEFTRVFRKYGIPKQIHTDNGSPFGSVVLNFCGYLNRNIIKDTYWTLMNCVYSRHLRGNFPLPKCQLYFASACSPRPPCRCSPRRLHFPLSGGVE